MGRRRKFSTNQILSHLERQLDFGQTAVSYCSDNRLCRSTFYKWRSLYNGKSESWVVKGEFVELGSSQEAAMAIVELDLQCGSKVRFYQGADKELIAHVIGKL